MKHIPATEYIGKTIGNIRLVEALGEGGMGLVFRAEHIHLGAPFAVKLIHQELTQHESIVERFRREAIVCSKLHHPNIVFLTDFGTDEHLGLYIVMEYLQGQSLGDWLAQNSSPTLWQTVAIVQQICSALAATHQHDVIHRDLKPENIFLLFNDGQRPHVKLLDFGIARFGHQVMPQLTPTGALLGTPEYIAPEMIQGAKDIGPPADIYATGILLYEMLAGATPFQADDPITLLTQHIKDAPAPLDAIRPELAGSQLTQLVHRMLHKQPQDRPGSMEEVQDCLASALQELQARGLPGTLFPTQPPPAQASPAPRFSPRTQEMAAATGTAPGPMVSASSRFPGYRQNTRHLSSKQPPGSWLLPLMALEEETPAVFVATHGHALLGWLQGQAQSHSVVPVVIRALASLVEDVLNQLLSPTPDPFLRRWTMQTFPVQLSKLPPPMQNLVRQSIQHLSQHPMFPTLPSASTTQPLASSPPSNATLPQIAPFHIDEDNES